MAPFLVITHPGLHAAAAVSVLLAAVVLGIILGTHIREDAKGDLRLLLVSVSAVFAFAALLFRFLAVAVP